MSAALPASFSCRRRVGGGLGWNVGWGIFQDFACCSAAASSPAFPVVRLGGLPACWMEIAVVYLEVSISAGPYVSVIFRARKKEPPLPYVPYVPIYCTFSVAGGLVGIHL